MSIARSGLIGKSTSAAAAVGKQLRLIKLQPVKRVVVTFDPFHEAAVNCRDFVFNITAPKILGTNPSCLIKTEIVCDRREPSISCLLNPEVAGSSGLNTINFKAGNLSCLELLQLYNKYITPLAPKEEAAIDAVDKKSNKLKKQGGKK
ncbi:mitochondrial ribosomal protein L53 [Arctopsyche grandis]|uniref:mitochondrial ribosomal protein L53 n=1 Tax=Arctopsyche grandis TaxID=121162 RepID=UPI00406D708E